MRGERSHKRFVFAWVVAGVLLASPLWSMAGLITQETDRPTQAAIGKNSLTVLEDSMFTVPRNLVQESSVGQAVATITHNVSARQAREGSSLKNAQGILFATFFFVGLFLLAGLSIWRRRRNFASRPYQGPWSWFGGLSRYWHTRRERDAWTRAWSSRSWQARPWRTRRSPAKTGSASSRSRRSYTSRSRRSQSSKW